MFDFLIEIFQVSFQFSLTGGKQNIKPKTTFFQIFKISQKSTLFFLIFKINFSEIDHNVEFVDVIMFKKNICSKKISSLKSQYFFCHVFAKKIISVHSQSQKIIHGILKLHDVELQRNKKFPHKSCRPPLILKKFYKFTIEIKSRDLFGGDRKCSRVFSLKFSAHEN